MSFFLALSLVAAVSARATTFDQWSAVLTAQDTTTIIASQVPDPVTGVLQPIVALNTSKGSYYVGPRKSYIGGHVLMYTNNAALTYNSGSRLLDVFDLSQNGWLTYPSTNVTKTAAGSTIYSRNCTALFNCPFFSSGIFYPLTNTAAISLEVDRRGTPLFLNLTYGGYYFAFTSFDKVASTYQQDPSIYTLPARAYDPAVPHLPPNITTFSFHRSMRNDSYVRNIWNDNAATPSGEASWAGCQSATSDLVYARFDLQIDQNFGKYSFCNSGQCTATLLTYSQQLGVEFPWGGTSSPYPNSFWYSIPQAARCAKGFPIGTNNCSVAYSYKIVKSITAACFVASAGNFTGFNGVPNSLCSGNLTSVGAYIDTVLDPSNALCPDITPTLAPLPDDS